MKAPRFDYVRPDTLPAALEALAAHGGEAAILAGGQSLMPMMNLRMARPGVVIDVNRIAALSHIEATPHHLTIGATARHVEVMQSPAVRTHAPLVGHALAHVAHAAIRNRGTLGGSLALADPAAELPACMVCLGADIVLASVRGRRNIAAADFFHGVYATGRAPDEMIVAVEIPSAQPGWRFVFDEVARRRGDFALAGLAFAALPDKEVRLAFCGVEIAPRRLPQTEAAIIEGGEIAAALARELEPMAGAEYPPAYRLRLATTLLSRALTTLKSA